MTPRELLGTAAVPGGQELRLYRRGGDFMIVLDRNELMSSRMNGSEKALALMTLERLGKRAERRAQGEAHAVSADQQMRRLAPL